MLTQSLSMHDSSINLSERALSLLYSASHADMQGPGPDQSRQYISALAILFVAIFIGVPIWWKTTEVYRCPLPYKEISELAHQQVNVMAAVPNAIYQVCEEHFSSSSSSSSQAIMNRDYFENPTKLVVSTYGSATGEATGEKT